MKLNPEKRRDFSSLCVEVEVKCERAEEGVWVFGIERGDVLLNERRGEGGIA